MATYTTVRSGSRGSSVSQLQQLLNANGYGLSEDGIFGSKTAAAVRDYQQKNNLAVDGIVGNNTWSSLYGNGGAATSGSANISGSIVGGYTAKDYGVPAPTYDSAYKAQIQQLVDQSLNREAFSYDFSADPTYQLYKDKAVQQGKLAMMDTMGAAAALTGGYGSSYGQTVGQQAYQQKLQDVNDIIPELADAAYGKYNDDYTKGLQDIQLVQGLEDTDYGRFRDKYGDWEGDRALWWQQQEAARDQANWSAEFALAQQAAAAKSSGGSGNGGGDGRSYYSLDDTKTAIDQIYRERGVSTALSQLRSFLEQGLITQATYNNAYSYMSGRKDTSTRNTTSKGAFVRGYTDRIN